MVIISAGVGAGHDGAAAQLAVRLAAHGYTVDRHDLLDLLPLRMGAAIRGTYHRMLVWAPWAYQRVFAATEANMRTAGRPGPLIRLLFKSAEPGMLKVLPPDTAAVVSTYFGASQVLGALRRRGRIDAPVLTYFTDLSVHPMWVAPGVDAHLAVHPIAAAQARALGAAGIEVGGPVVDATFFPATDAERTRARATFGLPAEGRLALLVAGSWGVGPVYEAAMDVRASGLAEPVVVCGRNTALAERLRADGIAYAFGWVTDMATLMRAADVLVQNAGGLTSLEAFASGLPVATYGCIPGHGRANAEALEEAGLAVWVRGADRLPGVLAELLDGPRGERQRAAGLALFAAATGPADVICRTARTARTARTVTPLAPATAPAARPVPARRNRRSARTLARPIRTKLLPARSPARRSRPTLRRLSPVAAFAAALWMGTAGTEMAVSRGAFGAVTSSADAYLVVHPPADGVLNAATVRALHDAHAAVAIDTRQASRDPTQVRRLARAGVPIVNAGSGPPYTTAFLRRGGISAGATALRRLTGTAPRYYLSSGDVDAIDVSLVRRDGERLLIPGRRLPCRPESAPALRPGRVTLIECDTGTAASMSEALRQLHATPIAATAPPAAHGRPTVKGDG